MGIINLTLVLRSLKGRCYGNQLIWGAFAIIKFDRLQSLHRHFEMECSSAICIRALRPNLTVRIKLVFVTRLTTYDSYFVFRDSALKRESSLEDTFSWCRVRLCKFWLADFYATVA